VSFDLFVNCFEHGEKGVFPGSMLERLFGPQIVSRKPEFSLWSIDYGQNNTSDIYVSFEDGVKNCSGFTINRPCADIRLFEAIYAVLADTNSVLFYPSDDPPLIGKVSTRQHLPQDMVDSLGGPILMNNGREILAHIKS
jgi:hypothetical protein